MSEKSVVNIEDRVKPVRMTDEIDGKVYELDFCRESILFAQRNKFSLEDALAYPAVGLRDLFYYSFRKNHKNVARDKTDKLFDRWGGGIPDKLAKRLIKLYQQAEASNSIVLDDDEEARKNSKLTLEIDD